MRQDLAFASIRQGDISASEGWKLLAPMMDTTDQVVADRLFDALRAWAWKALDRRRRDQGLREWIDVLNRVEGFLADRFDRLAAKVEVLAEMLHESIAVAELADPEAVLKRKHVRTIVRTLACREGEWVERGDLMRSLRLKPANTTRLMSLLVDLGWIEQATVGREASYRLSSEGFVYARAATAQAVSVEVPTWNRDELKSTIEHFRASFHYHVRSNNFIELSERDNAGQKGSIRPWDDEAAETIGMIDTEWEEYDEELHQDYEIIPAAPLVVRERLLA